MAHLDPSVCVQISNLLDELSHTTGLDQFHLIGGKAIDPIIKNNISAHADTDLTCDSELHEISLCRTHLKDSGFYNCTERNYEIRGGEPVKILTASRATIDLDITFMREPRDVGCFNIETASWHYPKCEFWDPYDSLQAIDQNKMELLPHSKMENPYLLIGRLLRLASKYSISLIGDPVLSNDIEEINSRIKDFPKNDLNYFQSTAAPISAFASLLKSIVQSKSRGQFIEELYHSGVINTLCPELDTQSIFNAILERCELTNTRSELILAIQEILLDKPVQLAFNSRVESLESRTWDTNIIANDPQDKPFLSGE